MSPWGHQGSLFMWRGSDFFDEDDGSRSVYVIVDFLSYWLSWYGLSSRPEDGLTLYVFPLAILIVKRLQFALGPFYLVPYDCDKNSLSSGEVQRGYARDSCSLQMFIWGDSPCSLQRVTTLVRLRYKLKGKHNIIEKRACHNSSIRLQIKGQIKGHVTTLRHG